MQPGVLVIPDQVIDYLGSGTHLDDGSDGQLRHIDFTEPYHPRAATGAGSSGRLRGYILPDECGARRDTGPRLETAAEIRRLAADGCDVVGMTGMPEAALARELELAYASVLYGRQPPPPGWATNPSRWP